MHTAARLMKVRAQAQQGDPGLCAPGPGVREPSPEQRILIPTGAPGPPAEVAPTPRLSPPPAPPVH